MSKTTIINLYGGPGSGKSTSAAYIYYVLKAQGKNVELVREYIKEWAYSERYISIYDQLYILGKQSRKESLLYGKVDYIITDSPVLMCAYYAQRYCPANFAEGIKASANAFYQQAEKDGHIHHHVFLNRKFPYKKEGRYQEEDEAKEIDLGIETLLKDLLIPFEYCSSSESDIMKLISDAKFA